MFCIMISWQYVTAIQTSDGCLVRDQISSEIVGTHSE